MNIKGDLSKTIIRNVYEERKVQDIEDLEEIQFYRVSYHKPTASKH